MSGGSRRRRLQDIQRVMDSLREPVQAPDLTDAILQEVDERRPFLSVGARRMLVWARFGLAGAAVLAIGVVVGVHIAAPDQTSWAGRAAPATDLLVTAETQTAEVRQSIRNGFESMPRLPENFETLLAVAPPAPPATEAERPEAFAALSKGVGEIASAVSRRVGRLALETPIDRGSDVEPSRVLVTSWRTGDPVGGMALDDWMATGHPFHRDARSAPVLLTARAPHAPAPVQPRRAEAPSAPAMGIESLMGYEAGLPR